MRYSADKLSGIDLGRQGENLARTIEIDVSSLLAQWPEADISLLVKRKHDADPYVANTEVRDGVLYWPITAADTASAGDGKVELRAVCGEVLAKSATGSTRVTASLTGNETDPPEAAQGWVDQVLEAGAGIQDSARQAENAAERAEQAADMLSGIRAKAVTTAPGTEAAVDVVDGVITYSIPRGDTGPQGAQGEQGVPGAQGAQGPQGIPGKDGKDGADGKDAVVDTTLTQSGQAADAKATGDVLACKLTEPSEGLAVGRYFRIASLDASGHAVLEAVTLPIAANEHAGMVQVSAYDGWYMKHMKNSIQRLNIHKGKLRAAAYCRVSTDLEEQEGSFETQMRYYREKIEQSPDMELVGIYGDKGRSGLKAGSRPELQRLLRDCKAGKIDLILTKSISRFARSMADCVELIRRLREWQVTIVFEKEGLRTDDRKSDLVIDILAALAQEESHSVSQNSIRCHEYCASAGRPSSRAAYGYTRAEDGTWQVSAEEAARVRTAFRMAAEGCSYPDILNALNDMEQREHTGVTWLQKRLRHLLRNVVYQGDYYSHGTVCLTPGHQVVNRGYRDRFYIEEHHEPLVSRAMFERVQRMMDGGFLISYMPMTEEKRRVMQDESWKLDA